VSRNSLAQISQQVCPADAGGGARVMPSSSIDHRSGLAGAVSQSSPRACPDSRDPRTSYFTRSTYRLRPLAADRGRLSRPGHSLGPTHVRLAERAGLPVVPSPQFDVTLADGTEAFPLDLNEAFGRLDAPRDRTLVLRRRTG
jgi:hypothetical protein